MLYWYIHLKMLASVIRYVTAKNKPTSQQKWSKNSFLRSYFVESSSEKTEKEPKNSKKIKLHLQTIAGVIVKIRGGFPCTKLPLCLIWSNLLSNEEKPLKLHFIFVFVVSNEYYKDLPLLYFKNNPVSDADLIFLFCCIYVPHFKGRSVWILSDIVPGRLDGWSRRCSSLH